MRSQYKILEKDRSFFITSTIVSWIPIFSDEKYINILIDSIKCNQVNKDLKVYAYVIMPDHFHMIAYSEYLSSAIQSIKGYTAKKIINELKKDERYNELAVFKSKKLGYKTKSLYQVWQEGFHPKAILGERGYSQKVNYIHLNPVC